MTNKPKTKASELADWLNGILCNDPAKRDAAAIELRRLDKAERDAYAAIKPIEDWYFVDCDTGERLPFHEALKLAVEDMQSDRQDALKCRSQQDCIAELEGQLACEQNLNRVNKNALDVYQKQRERIEELESEELENPKT